METIVSMDTNVFFSVCELSFTAGFTRAARTGGAHWQLAPAGSTGSYYQLAARAAGARVVLDGCARW